MKPLNKKDLIAFAVIMGLEFWISGVFSAMFGLIHGPLADTLLISPWIGSIFAIPLFIWFIFKAREQEQKNRA